MKLAVIFSICFIFTLAAGSDLPLEEYRPIEERFFKDPDTYYLYLHYLNLFGSPSQVFGDSNVDTAAPSPRIVGGKVASPGQFPYQAALKISANDGNYFCGGSLISSQYVLTAAHCATGANQITVTLGAQNIRQQEPDQVNLVVKKGDINVHSGYNPQTIKNDIAILKLPNPVKFNNKIKAVGLPTKSDAKTSFAGSLATTSGWGKPRDSASSISEELRYVQTQIITQQSCKNIFYVIQDSNICASGKQGKSSCK